MREGREAKEGERREGELGMRELSFVCSLHWMHRLSINESFIPRLLNVKSKIKTTLLKYIKSLT